MTAKSVCKVAVATALAILPLAVSAVEPTGDRVSAVLDGATVPVTVNNFVAADTAGQFDRILKMTGTVNKLSRTHPARQAIGDSNEPRYAL